MQLLWLKSDFVMPPDSGGKIRSYNLLRELRDLCDVTYVSFKDDDTIAPPEIRSCAHRVVSIPRTPEIKSGLRFHLRVVRRMASRLPYTSQKYRCPQIITAQRQHLGSANNDSTILLCDFLEMSENVDWRQSCPKVLFQHNVESMIWDRYYRTETHPLKKAYFNYERKRMARYESNTCNRFDMIFTVSDQDRQVLIEDLNVRRPIEVLETGVDTKFFSAAKPQDSVRGRLLFLGSLDWMPNIDGLLWFVREVYPLLKSQRAGVSLDIVGRRPAAKIHHLQANDPTIRVIPDVPDVRPYVRQCEIFVVPLRVGGGSRIKIYEAMAMNRTVVSTQIGAEGLPLTADSHLAIADSASDFASVTTKLLSNQCQRNKLAKAGHDLVTEKYQWKNVAKKLKDHCQQLADRT